MQITVQVKLKAKQSRLEKIEDLLSWEEFYMAHVIAPPIEGQSNKEIIGLVSDYFNVSKSQVRIVSWLTSKIKIIKII